GSLMHPSLPRFCNLSIYLLDGLFTASSFARSGAFSLLPLRADRHTRGNQTFPSLAAFASIPIWQRRNKIGGGAAQSRLPPLAKRSPRRISRYRSCTPALNR